MIEFVCAKIVNLKQPTIKICFRLISDNTQKNNGKKIVTFKKNILLHRVEKKEVVMVSIIIPVYNTEPYIKACLQSVMRQTYDIQDDIQRHLKRKDDYTHILLKHESD